jgi:hypothetical protein
MTSTAPPTRAEYTLSDPPPDIRQDVVSVAQAAEPDGSQFRMSAPPPDVLQPVEVVASNLEFGGLPPAKEGEYAEFIGDAEDPEDPPIPPATQQLDLAAMYQIIRQVAISESGDDVYSAVASDEAGSPGRAPFGLLFGLVKFPQATGRLGSVLRLMQQRDAVAFADVFGPAADALLTATNALTAAERMRPVDGEPLWSATWIERFRRAGTIPSFQAAQNEEAIEGLFRPMLRIAFGLGFTTDRGLAMVYDRVLAHGLGGGVRWVVGASGPLRSHFQRVHAWTMLGFNDLREFQTSVAWTPSDGRFGPETHAALVGALRQQGHAPLPTIADLMCRLIGRSDGAARDRLLRLERSVAFTDVEFAPPADIGGA